MTDPSLPVENAAPDYACFDVRLRIGFSQLHIQAQMPRGSISLPGLLPVLQSLTDAVVAMAVRDLMWTGRRVSCGPGCGACCRQLVPISEIEALYLQDLLDSLESDHRARIEERFRVARRKLSDASLLDELRAAGSLDSRKDRRELGQRYFRLGLPCPFLENESCSIHAHRPLACREYLVTSPPVKCARLDSGEVETLELPRRPSATLYRFGDGVGATRPRWLPLTLMPEMAGNCDARIRRRIVPGPVLFERFLLMLASIEDQGVVSPETNDP